MDNNEVKIEELVLRLPGEYEDQAQNTGMEITKQVAEKLPEAIQNIHLDSLSIKIEMSQGTSQSELTKLISEAILRGLV